MLIAAVGREEAVAETGVTEFDAIGSAYNLSLARVKEHTAALAGELAERKLAEEQIRRKEARIRLILQSASEGIYGVDTEGNCTFVNPSCCRILGYDEGDLLGRNIHNLVHYAHPDGSHYSAEECRAYGSFRDNGETHEDTEVFWKADGSSFPVEYWAHPVIEDDQVVGAVVAFFDITERNHSVEQLLHAQKMEGIGHLAGGVAHDFNNILNVIQGYNDLLRMRCTDKALNNYSEHIGDAVKRGAAITRQILAFSRKGVESVQEVNLNESIYSLQKMLSRLVREDIEIQVDLSDDRLVIEADPGQIDQVLINLATNAADAMPDGGKLHVITGAVSLDEEFIKHHGFGKVGDFVLITVSDTGTGIPDEVKPRIFEPFFTTKKLGQGTGLGLSMAYGIIQKYHGYINVYSEVGRGTVFRIYLPRVAKASDHGIDGEDKAVELPPGGSETILLAEDDPDVRLWAQTMLAMRGYSVVEAVDGQDAVDKFVALQNSIDLVLLDGIMPNLNGREALVKMRALRPDLKVIIVSGYAEEVFTQDDLQNLGVTFVQKPVITNQLLVAIRQVLDRT